MLALYIYSSKTYFYLFMWLSLYAIIHFVCNNIEKRITGLFLFKIAWFFIYSKVSL